MRDNLDQLRHIEGFPIGEDEDLHALSDPPHYTAYPNPHIAEFIAKWGKPYDEATDNYHREPYITDVSEGKGEPLYNAHPYHTKVPYKAVQRFLEHYTETGELVLDAFCGTGMTAVAAVKSGRQAIVVDLSPSATFIARCYASPIDRDRLRRLAQEVLQSTKQECSWMYTTSSDGVIHYTTWSQVFRCNYCGEEVLFWDIATDNGRAMKSELRCTICAAHLSKRELTPVYGSDRRIAFRPVEISYTKSFRTRKHPETSDLELIERTEELQIPYWYPSDEIPLGDKTREFLNKGIVRVSQLFNRRNLYVLAKLYAEIARRGNPHLLWAFTAMLQRSTIMYRWNASRPTGILPGTFYVPSLFLEFNLIEMFERRIDNLLKLSNSGEGHALISTQSATDLRNIPTDSIDYIFTDPPFGDNLMYSELNLVWEAWLKVWTNPNREAVINRSQGKKQEEYRELMTASFREMWRTLKPGRWITVEFHNSKASIWNCIQDSLSRAGFIVAQVSVFDKGQGSFNQITAPGAVKNDLIINAYKPRKAFEERFLQRAGYGLEQEFVAQHLGMLPVEPNLERTAQMLYSKMLACYVQHGYEITFNADQFYRLLSDHFLERDGYWFRDEMQVQEYERRKLIPQTAKGRGGKKAAPLAQRVLFISDERSAIAWLHHFLETPRDYSEIYTAFVKALQVPEDQIPEIKALLEENFVSTNGQYKRPEMLEKQELEARRQQRLLREFGDILEQAHRGQRLKDVRKEAVLAGFAQCYREKRFEDILRVGRRLHKRIVESSTEIYDFIDIAEAKVG